MNVPNALTLLRIFFVPMLVAALVQGHVTIDLGFMEVTNEMLALSIFLAAAATDLLDGYIARRWGQITTVGTLLDPIADKLLISSALVALVQVHVVPAWMAIVVVGREFAISGLRSIAAAEGYIIQASDFGKAKLVSQVIAISLLLLSMRWIELRPTALFSMWVVVVLAVVSAILYFRKFWRKVDDKVKHRRRRQLILQQTQERKAARAGRKIELSNNRTDID
ncbi:MAG TPA: CDP-diacylglycerol--glycerol-3-phosphate 3-phosphatidyltransferase [Bryobacteraceae bacterium]|nr:CDP-diacylglycerol--glycerol-3-phosphate 3-phosphatidyltransferase [Bryobacteraceae bacterium]